MRLNKWKSTQRCNWFAKRKSSEKKSMTINTALIMMSTFVFEFLVFLRLLRSLVGSIHQQMCCYDNYAFYSLLFFSAFPFQANFVVSLLIEHCEKSGFLSIKCHSKHEMERYVTSTHLEIDFNVIANDNGFVILSLLQRRLSNWMVFMCRNSNKIPTKLISWSHNGTRKKARACYHNKNEFISICVTRNKENILAREEMSQRKPQNYLNQICPSMRFLFVSFILLLTKPWLPTPVHYSYLAFCLFKRQRKHENQGDKRNEMK